MRKSLQGLTELIGVVDELGHQLPLLDAQRAGVEMYGGLGDRYSFGTRLTSHYAGPTINWEAPHGLSLSFSPQFGLNDYSIPRLYRFGISYEIDQVWGRFHRGAR